MIHTAIIFGFIAIATGVALVYANKIMNGRQTRTVRFEARLTSRQITRK